MRSRPSPAKEEADKEMIWIIYYNNTFLLSTLVYPETKGGREGEVLKKKNQIETFPYWKTIHINLEVTSDFKVSLE